MWLVQFLVNLKRNTQLSYCLYFVFNFNINYAALILAMADTRCFHPLAPKLLPYYGGLSYLTSAAVACGGRSSILASELLPQPVLGLEMWTKITEGK